MARDPWNLLRQVASGSALRRLEESLIRSAEDDPACSYDAERREHVDASPLVRGYEVEERVSLAAFYHSFLQELGDVLVHDFRLKVDVPVDPAFKATYLDERIALASLSPAEEDSFDSITEGFLKRLTTRLREIAGPEVDRLAKPSIPQPEEAEGWMALAKYVYSQPQKGHSYEAVAWILRRWAWLRQDHAGVGLTDLYGKAESSIDDPYPSGVPLSQPPLPKSARDTPVWEQHGFPSIKTLRNWVHAAGMTWDEIGS